MYKPLAALMLNSRRRCEMEQYSDNEFHEALRRERDLERVLVSGLDPVTKVQRIMDMGVEEDEANDMVEKYQIGQMAPVYYERLSFDDDEETEED
jgi:hypothetical protein